MAPITEHKKQYINAVVIVEIITMICLVFFWAYRSDDLVRCYLKPVHEKSEYRFPTNEIINLDEEKIGTTIEWNGLTKTMHDEYWCTETVHALSLRSYTVIGCFILTITVTLFLVAIAIYYIIRNFQLIDPAGLALSGGSLVIVLVLGVIVSFSLWKIIRTDSFVEPDSSFYDVEAHAPIIYLYDEEYREATVKLNLNGELTCTYPSYGDGWTVKTSPDGTLTDANGREYEYLFWEANLDMVPDTSKGFCVKGPDSALFLERALSDLGLTDKEANAFIMYWLPALESNPYNVICFQTEEFENAAKLEVTPSPDTIVRVNMFFYATDEYAEIEEQDLTSMNPSPAERDGFVLVEWGGETVNSDDVP